MDFQEEVFCSIYMQYLPMVRNIARNHQIPQDDSEDVVQNVFYAFYKAYGTDKPEEESRKLLTMITKNCCLDYKRKEISHPEFSCDPVVIQEELFPDLGINADNLSILLRMQEYENVAEALRSLKKGPGDVMRLHVIEGRSMAEVAKILGVKEETCRVRLSRARAEMRRLCNRQTKAEQKSRKKLSKDMSVQKA